MRFKLFIFLMVLFAGMSLTSWASAQPSDNSTATAQTTATNDADSSDQERVVGAAEDWEIDLVEGFSPVKIQMNDFHNMMMWIISIITLVVLALLLYVIVKFNRKTNPIPSTTTHNTKLEIVWTLIPVLILLFVVIPSMRLLFYTDKIEEADMTIVATGYQWYWGYEYPDNGGFSFMSYMIPDDELEEGQKRLLETDNRVIVPVGKTVRVQVRSNDVLHAFAVPSLGVKIDAIPGHTNETWFRAEKPGVFYGQCSELCGTNHAFMPITIEAVPQEEFDTWVESAQEEFSDMSDYNKNIQIAYLGDE